ncbi:hypothetical protein ACSHWO_19945 [Streptomyces sp. HUAS TT3]|uniref:hypothetical protein n=1 Tax=Streptomyces sp. HUAS TT3 TaxID=3447510 RepID=UPI003F65BBC3
MSDNAPVDPAEVPVFTGDLVELDAQIKAISSGGAAVSTKAGDVHSSFGGLQAFYRAPEADQLFATTKPVSDLGLKLSGDMCTIAGALGAYARDVAPLKKKLEDLKREAETFRSKVADDEKWREDGDLIDENLDRRNEIAEVWAQFQAVERTAYAKIVALVGGKPLKVNDGSNAADMYGYDGEALKQAKSLPWGDAVEESVPAWQVWEHAWDFGKGFVVDGVWGTIKGLGGLVGLQGWDTFKQSWTGLAKLGTGLAISSIPGVGPLFLAAPSDKLPSWLRDSRTAMKETGKALLAWDQWGSNPSRAAGAVTFNVLTTVFTGGSGGAVSGAGKAGAVAKALSFAGKAGRVVDPMTYVFKGAGAGFSKIGDVMAGLRGMGKIETPSINIDGAVALPDGAKMLPDGSIHLPSGSSVPEGAIKLADGTVKLPEGTVTLPEGTVKLPVDGPPQFMDPKGNLYDAAGNAIQRADDAPVGKPGADPGTPKADVPKADTPAPVKAPDRVLTGVGGRGDDGIRLGSDTSEPVHVPGDHTPGGPRPDTTPGGHAPDNMPRNSVDGPTAPGPRPDAPSPGGHADTPSTGGPADVPGPRTDGPSTGDGHPGTPGGAGHPDGPSTGGGHSESPGAGGADDLGDGADDAARAGDDAAGGPYTHGPDGGWSGAGWVEKPSEYGAAIYDSLRSTPNHIDVPVMARNTGLSESVIRDVKSHMIRSQHDVVIGPGDWRRGRFTPRDDIADLWDGARKGTLTEAQLKEFRNLMTHEYVESKLMKSGLPYLRDEAGLWRKEPDGTYQGGGRYSPKSLSAAGAHDLSPNPVRGGFGYAWQKLGLKHPKTVLAHDLSNIDDFVKDVFRELRAKGLDLK